MQTLHLMLAWCRSTRSLLLPELKHSISHYSALNDKRIMEACMVTAQHKSLVNVVETRHINPSPHLLTVRSTNIPSAEQNNLQKPLFSAVPLCRDVHTHITYLHKNYYYYFPVIFTMRLVVKPSCYLWTTVHVPVIGAPMATEIKILEYRMVQVFDTLILFSRKATRGRVENPHVIFHTIFLICFLGCLKRSESGGWRSCDTPRWQWKSM